MQLDARKMAEKENHGLDDHDQERNRKKIRRPGARQKELREACRKVLTDWRLSTWTTNLQFRPFNSLAAVLPDTAITKLATRARIKTLADIKEEVPEWKLVDQFGEEVLRLIQPLDASWKEENERKKSARKEERARLNKENRVKRYEEYLERKRQESADRKALEEHRHALHTAGQHFPPTASSSSVVSYAVPGNSLGRVLVPQPYYVYSVPYLTNNGHASGHARSYMYSNTPYPMYQWPG